MHIKNKIDFFVPKVARDDELVALVVLIALELRLIRAALDPPETCKMQSIKNEINIWKRLAHDSNVRQRQIFNNGQNLQAHSLTLLRRRAHTETFGRPSVRRWSWSFFFQFIFSQH